jgi:hypothetical protein
VFERAGDKLLVEANGQEQPLGFVKVFISGHSNQCITHKWCFVYFSDSLNRPVYASLPVGRLGVPFA